MEFKTHFKVWHEKKSKAAVPWKPATCGVALNDLGENL